MEPLNQINRKQVAIAAIAIVTVGLSVYLIQRARANYQAKVALHAEQVKQIDPALIAEWETKVKLENTLRGLRQEFRDLNLERVRRVRWNKMTNRVETHYEWVTVNKISLLDYKNMVMGNPARAKGVQEACEALGWSVDEAFLQLQGPLPRIAGPSPIPSGPSAAWAFIKAFFQVNFAAGLGGTSAYLLWKQSPRGAGN